MHPDDLRQGQDTIFLSRKNASALLHRSDDVTAIEPSDPIIPANNAITVALPESRVNRNDAARLERKIPLSFPFQHTIMGFLIGINTFISCNQGDRGCREQTGL
jgi:hypothetical protein